MEDKSNLYIVAIVGVVAIVALVVMVTMQSKSVNVQGYNSEDVVGYASIGYSGCISKCLNHESGDAYNMCSYGCLNTWMSQQK